MILTKNAILSELQAGRIQVEPFDENQVQVASIDLTLGKTFRIFKKIDDPVNLTESTNYRDFSEEITAEQYVLQPGETILGITVEKITLPGDICGVLEGRSRFARMGLNIHITAGLIQPGVSNQQVLEITNLGKNQLILHAGQHYCQIAFERCEGSAMYNGKFQGQSTP